MTERLHFLSLSNSARGVDIFYISHVISVLMSPSPRDGSILASRQVLSEPDSRALVGKPCEVGRAGPRPQPFWEEQACPLPAGFCPTPAPSVLTVG